MGKTVFITGGSRGIGKAMVEVFAKNNYNVVFCYNNSFEKANQIIDKQTNLGYKVKAIKMDISDEKAVQESLENLYKSENIDILINNAGICLPQKMLIDTTFKEWKKIFDVNVNGTFLVSKFIADKMMFTGGNIINISSIWGVAGGSCEVCYSASKSAIIGFTKALAKELGSANINVNCIAPGVINTEMNSHLNEEDIEELKDNTPIGRIGTPEDIANVALFLASDKANFITGQIINSNGGFVI